MGSSFCLASHTPVTLEKRWKVSSREMPEAAACKVQEVRGWGGEGGARWGHSFRIQEPGPPLPPVSELLPNPEPVGISPIWGTSPTLWGPHSLCDLSPLWP